MKKILIIGFLAVSGCGIDAMKDDYMAKYQFDLDASSGEGFAYLSRRTRTISLISIVPSTVFLTAGTGLIVAGIVQNNLERSTWGQTRRPEAYLSAGVGCEILGLLSLIYGLSASNTSREYRVRWYSQYRKNQSYVVKTRQHVLSLAIDLQSPNRNVRLNALLSLAKYGPRAATAVTYIVDLLKTETDRQVRAAAHTALNRILGKRYASSTTR
ncbi:MAG: HEAT repeat domain-containing protein [Planctomycetota bacterium]